MPKSKATALVQPPPSAEEIHGLFDSGRISLWKEKVECLRHDREGLQGVNNFRYYLQGSTTQKTGKERELHNMGEEFGELVKHLFQVGTFRLHENLIVEAIDRAFVQFRRGAVEATLTQQPYNDEVGYIRRLCLAVVPYATADALKKIGNWNGGCQALAHCLREQPDRAENVTTTATYFSDMHVRWIEYADDKEIKVAEKNNYDLWLREPLRRRILVGYHGDKVWNIGDAKFKDVGVENLLNLLG